MTEQKKQITSMSLENRVFNPPASLTDRAWIKSREQYEEMWKRSIDDPEGFWGEVAEGFEWFKKWDKVNEEDYKKADIKWFIGGKTNITVNALDRHIKAGKGEQVAIFWEGDSPDESKAITYQEMYDKVNKLANVLKDNGANMTPVAMLLRDGRHVAVTPRERALWAGRDAEGCRRLLEGAR